VQGVGAASILGLHVWVVYGLWPFEPNRIGHPARHVKAIRTPFIKAAALYEQFIEQLGIASIRTVAKRA
jgi:hypothetical protein